MDRVDIGVVGVTRIEPAIRRDPQRKGRQHGSSEEARSEEDRGPQARGQEDRGPQARCAQDGREEALSHRSTGRGGPVGPPFPCPSLTSC